jgi:hypothetical protein
MSDEIDWGSIRDLAQKTFERGETLELRILAYIT